jgi:multiple sugar transport system permease protein
MPTLIGVDVWWQTAFVFIIILAGLQSIPQEPIESARIEGATEWQITRYIRLPMIKSLVLLVIIFRSIDTLKIFDLVWGITGGGPGISTEVVQTYSYRLAFGFLQMSKSMTVMILFSSVVISLTLIYSLIEKRNND